MRFSTRNTHKRGKAIALAASAAILGVGGTVGYISQKDASAETSSVDINIFYANTSEYTSVNNAAAAAATTLGVEEAAFCNIGSGTGGAVTRVNPNTHENAEYWVFAKTSTQCPSTAVAPEGEVLLNNNGATILDKTYDDTYMAANYALPLGPLGAFHVIGFDQLDLGNQTNGNILTPNLNSAGSYIGYFEEPTISYARSIGTSISSNFSFANAHTNGTNVLVTGRTTAVGIGDNGEKWTINAAKANMPDRIINGEYANNLWQESATSTPFMDIAALKTEALSWNKALSEQNPTLSGEDYDFSDQNNLTINVPSSANNTLSVLKLDKELLQGHHDICVYGYDQHVPGTLLINVDLAGETDFEMNNSFKLCYKTPDLIKYPDSIRSGATNVSEINFDDNSKKCVREQWIHDKFENHIIVNFYDSTASTKNYSKNLTIARETTSFVVAPEADVEITASSFQGILISDTLQSRADTYYLSLHDLQPLTPTTPEICKVVVNHYLNRTRIRVADVETHETVCDHGRYTIDKTSDFFAEYANKGLKLTSAYYNNTGESIVIDIPLETKNDLPVKNYDIFYDADCALKVLHKNKQTDQVILGYSYEYVNACQDNTPYNISKLENIESLGYEFTDAKYNDNGESSPIIYQSDNPAESVQELIYDGDIIDKQFMPLVSWNDLPAKTITLYYEPTEEPVTPEEPEEPETPETPETKDNKPVYVLTAASTIFGLSTAGLFLVRRRQ